MSSYETVGGCILKNESFWAIDANKQTSMRNTVAYHHEPSQRDWFFSKFVTIPKYHQYKRVPSTNFFMRCIGLCIYFYNVTNRATRDEILQWLRRKKTGTRAVWPTNSTTSSTTTKKTLRNAFLFVRFSSRVLHYAKKIAFRNSVTDPIILTVSPLCSTQLR